MTLEKAEFEKRFLALVAQHDVVITAPNIAYHLSIPIEEAQDRLLDLELNGTLQQMVDPQGNSYYLMPNRPTPGTLPATLHTRSDSPAGASAMRPGVYNPAELPAAPMYSSPGAPGRNVNGMVLNVIFPGAGSLLCGEKIGIAMMLLAIMGLIILLLPLGWGRLIGLLPILAGWIWSIVAGIRLLDTKKPVPGASPR